MLQPFKKLLCTAALASAALAQTITIASPAPGTALIAGSSFTVDIQELVPQSSTIEEVAIVIGATPCVGDCPDPSQSLAQSVLYSGLYNPQTTNPGGYPNVNYTASFTVTVPNYFDGTAQIAAAHIYLDYGVYGVGALKVQYATTNISISGAVG